MKLCYAGNTNRGLHNMSNDSLTQWVIGAGLAAMTTVLGFLMKWVFGRLTGGIEELRRDMAANADRDEAGHEKIASEMRMLSHTVQKQDTSIALISKDIGYLQGEVLDLRQELERLRAERRSENGKGE